MFIPAFKGHSSLWDRADLKKFTPTWNQSSFRISAPIFAVVCLIFNRSLKNLFECPFASPMILFLSYLVKNSIMSGVYRVSAVTCKLAMKWYLMRMCVSWLCPFHKLQGTSIKFQSRSQSLVPRDQRSENESSGSNHFEITKEIIEFCPSGFTQSASMAHHAWNGCSQSSQFQNFRPIWEC